MSFIGPPDTSSKSLRGLRPRAEEGEGAQGILSSSFLVTPNWTAWDGWAWGRRLSISYASLCKWAAVKQARGTDSCSPAPGLLRKEQSSPHPSWPAPPHPPIRFKEEQEWGQRERGFQNQAVWSGRQGPAQPIPGGLAPDTPVACGIVVFN